MGTFIKTLQHTLAITQAQQAQYVQTFQTLSCKPLVHRARLAMAEVVQQSLAAPTHSAEHQDTLVLLSAKAVTFTRITQHTLATTQAQQAQPAQILQMRNYRQPAQETRYVPTEVAQI